MSADEVMDLDYDDDDDERDAIPHCSCCGVALVCTGSGRDHDNAKKKVQERAKKAEALLREIAAVPLVGLTLGSVLLAKIREALAGK